MDSFISEREREREKENFNRPYLCRSTNHNNPDVYFFPMASVIINT